ncbi:unnamed protein product, partial [Mesorhabditis spiculigera]
MAFFTTTLELSGTTGLLGLPEKSIYPVKAPEDKRFWRCKLSMDHFNEGYEMFEVRRKREWLDDDGKPVYTRWGGQDFILFVKSRQAARFINRPGFYHIPTKIQRSLALHDGQWYSTDYRASGLYCKVGVLGSIPLPICVRVPEKLLLDAAREVSVALVREVASKVDNDWRNGWTNRSDEERATMVRNMIEFLRKNICRSWGCGGTVDGNPRQLATDIAIHIWKYAEWLAGTEEQLQATSFYQDLIKLAHSHATHGTLPCNCHCNHWDTISKRAPKSAETLSQVLEGDEQIAAILNKLTL